MFPYDNSDAEPIPWFRATGSDAANNPNQADWMDFGMRIAVSSALHPFEYAKTLIQVNDITT